MINNIWTVASFQSFSPFYNRKACKVDKRLFFCPYLLYRHLRFFPYKSPLCAWVSRARLSQRKFFKNQGTDLLFGLNFPPFWSIKISVFCFAYVSAIISFCRPFSTMASLETRFSTWHPSSALCQWFPESGVLSLGAQDYYGTDKSWSLTQSAAFLLLRLWVQDPGPSPQEPDGLTFRDVVEIIDK